MHLETCEKHGGMSHKSKAPLIRNNVYFSYLEGLSCLFLFRINFEIVNLIDSW